MFQDLYDDLNNLERVIVKFGAFLERALPRFIPLVEERIITMLVSEAEEAARNSPEYGVPQARPLVDRLLQNLSARTGDGFVHVKVFRDATYHLIDTNYLGTYEDLVAGQYAGTTQSRNPQSLRYRFWKYGIYIPSVEGPVESESEWFKKATLLFPSYEEVIHMRLLAWGHKAPYWYFLEYGNTGGDKKYPVIGPTYFITNLRLMLDSELPRLFEAFEQAIEEAFNSWFGGGEPEPEDIFFRTWERAGRVWLQPFRRLPSGRVFFAPGGRYLGR